MPIVRTTTARVVIPFVSGRLRRATVDAVGDAWFARLEDDHAYWRLLCDLWAHGEAFVIVEQDIVPSPGMVQELWDCPHEWCAFPYSMGAITTTALGFTKFGETLLERTAGLVDGIIVRHRYWSGLDCMIIGELHRRGMHEHEHQPAVRHLHDYSPPEPRRSALTKLKYVGAGGYLNGIPAADFETWDQEKVAICLESGLYEEVTPVRRRIGKIEQPDLLTKFVPFSLPPDVESPLTETEPTKE